jgi:release factor glutamine methyltransferase
VIASLGATTSRARALSVLANAFRDSEIDEPEREARLVLIGACRLAPLDLIMSPEEVIGEAVHVLQEVALRRAAREPLSRIFGRREFWGLSLAISRATLDPRPETEVLVEAALEHFAARRTDSLRILDLGVGSAAILCALLGEFPNAWGIGVDLSAAAAEVAARNLDACGLTSRASIIVGDWTSATEYRFDLIVSNPPYIRSADIEELAPEVRFHDPLLALDGGEDGLAAYRAILPIAASLLLPGGAILVETGAGQAPDVFALASRAGLAGYAPRHDLAGIERVVIASKPSEVGLKSKGRRDEHGVVVD